MGARAGTGAGAGAGVRAGVRAGARAGTGIRAHMEGWAVAGVAATTGVAGGNP